MVAVTGTGSGLDIDGLVASLVAAERVPAETRLNAREAKITRLSTSFSSAKAAVSDFEVAANKLALASTFSQFTTSSSDSTKATVSAADSASLGSYQLSVSSLATAQTLASGNFSATTDTLGTGTLTIALGTPAYTGSTPDTYSSFTEASSVAVTIDSSNNTLAGVRDAINNANAGVNASILKNGSNYQLFLVSESTGAANSMSISVSGDSSGYGYGFKRTFPVGLQYIR
jgi:flagellar hook-associated protein 2